MKHHLLSFLLMLLPLAANAVVIDGIYYNLHSTNKTAEVTSSPDYYTGEIIIPNSVMYNNISYDVTSIGRKAFWWCSKLTKIVIPNTVTTIEDEAFAYCMGITDVDIPNSITNIGMLAFRDCTGLTTITVGNSVTSIGDYAFQGCNVLESVTIPNSVTTIGVGLFSVCSGLKSVAIGNSVTAIERDVFFWCSNLKNVTIPNSVTSIGAFAFYGCENLATLSIPHSVTSIGEEAFSGCKNMDHVYCYADPKSLNWGDYDDQYYFKPDKGTLFHVYNKEEWEEVFPNANVTFVEDLPMEGDANSEDVTHYIQNAGFDEDLTWQADGSKKDIVDKSTTLSDRSLAGIAADSSVYALVNPSTPKRRSDGRTLEASNGFIGRVHGWTIETNQTFPKCEWVYFGTIPYNLASQAIPIADDGSTYLEVPTRPEAYCGDNNVGFAYLRAGWGGRAVYKQVVKLPCAVYCLEYWAINKNPNGMKGKNLSKVVCGNDTWKDDTGFSDTEWTRHTIKFTPTSEFTIEFGFESSGGSGSNPFLCIDGIKLYKIGEAGSFDLLRSDYLDAVAECKELARRASGENFIGLASYLSNYAMEIDDISQNTDQAVLKASLTVINARMVEIRKAVAAMDDVNATLFRMDNLLKTTNFAGKATLEAVYQKILGYKVNGITENTDVVAQLLGAKAEGDKAIEAYNRSQMVTLTFETTGVGCEGIAPTAQIVEIGTIVKIPANTTLFCKGKTLNAWTDGANQYTAGQEVTVNADITLTPVFTDNTVTLADRTTETVIVWQFGVGNGTGTLNAQGKSTILVTQATIGESIIDVKMDIDATNGKINNVGRGDKWAQCNDGTIFTIPAYRGTAVAIDSYGDANGTTIGGIEATNKAVTYKGTAETIDIVAKGINYIASVTAVYPDPGQSIEDEVDELTLEISPNHIEEGTEELVKLKIARSGSWDSAEAVVLKATEDSRVIVPATITIPARQSAAVAYLSITNNDVVDNDSVVEITAMSDKYKAVTARLVIEDDELPALKLTASNNVVNEGETIQLAISRSQHLQEALTVTLTCEKPKRFSYPQQVTIPAGQQSVTVDVVAKDDDVPSETLSVVFAVSAPNAEKSEVIVLLEDDDMPVLELSLQPNKVQEGAGPVSVAGTLRRTTNKDSKITVKLTDDADGDLYFGNRTLVLQKGTEEVSFNFGPVDNAQVDGDKTYTITASVWLSSCSCSASGQSAGTVSAALEVLDDDGPALTIASSLSTIKEGGKAMLTVGRNTLVSMDQPLIVHLSSDYDDNLSYNHTITIPAGQQTAQVEVTSTKNDVSGDTHTAVFTVQTDGFASATCYLMVTDQTLPDAVITDISVAENEVEVGGMATVNVTVKNGGQAILPAKTPVNIYVKGESETMHTLCTQEELAPGSSTTITRQVKVTTAPGNKQLYAIVNEERRTDELFYNNNTSVSVDLRVVSPYHIVIHTDKTHYLPGDTVRLTGSVSGSKSENTEVEVYIINEGVRQTFNVVADTEGRFSIPFVPYERQMGHFVCGACYPNEGLTTEICSFDFVGLRRTSQQYITCDVIVGNPYTGVIEIENPTSQSLHNVKAEVVYVSDFCNISFVPVSEVSAGAQCKLQYTINAFSATLQSEWKGVKVRVICEEGASTELCLYCRCRLPQAQLALDINELNTTLTKGTTRDYPINITNNGAGETGPIFLSLPTVIQAGTPIEMASLKPGETSTAMLRLIATDDMQLNVPITGQIGINCENGNGIALPFILQPVSESKGRLVVDVCDEYTYYTVEAPHVKGAKVLLRYPYSDEIVAEGVTGDDGTYAIELPEGYYALSIEAEKHGSYKNNIIIDPGREKRKVVNLSYEAIKVGWKVEETEVEDQYEIATTLTYETNVPAPVVVTELPEMIPVDSFAPGEARLYYATLTNKGLIAAEGVQLSFPKVEYLTIEPLIEFPLTLSPQQVVRVPFKVTLLEDVISSNGNEMQGRMKAPRRERDWKIVCETNPKTIWFHWCGNDHQYHHYNTKIPLKVREKCKLVGSGGERDGDDEEGYPNGGDGFIWIGGGGSGGAPVQEDKGCKTCIEILKERVKDKLIEGIPIYGCMYTTSKCTKDAIDRSKNGDVNIPDYKIMKCETDVLECTLLLGCDAWSSETIIGPAICEGIHKIKVVLEVLEALTDLKECFWISLENAESRKIITDSEVPSYVKEMDKCTSMLGKQIDAFIEYNTELFGDESWLDVDYSELYVLLDALLALGDKPVDETALNLYCPTNISHEQLVKFIYRFNNTFYGGKYEIGGQIDFDKISECLQIILSEEQHAESLGYLSVEDMWVSEFKKYKERLNEASNSVCASVTLQIEQTMTLTRPAYRGTLTVFNGHEEIPMENVRLNLVVKDEAGRIASEREFQMNAESLDGFGGEVSLTSNWTLEAQKTGKATVLFIPTKYAAPSEPVKYSFGGILTYIDPFTGLEVTRDIFPVTMTVNPLPDLELTYLMQRDIYGDDPLTEDVAEPMEPAEFALIINNKGNGEAKNVKMLTEQPKIIENEKDLLVNFEIVSSQMNGAPASLSFGQTIANDFGTIVPHSQSYAQWWLQSSLLGHFTSYEVAATHVTDYGNVHLSLIDTVTIHEMIHGFTPLTSPKRGFLVNDIVDADDLPDVVYFTDATQQPLYMATANISRLSNSEFMLTTTTKQPGWNYGSVADPTGGRLRLAQITRSSDGTILPLDNMWQTNRTLRDAREWLNENRLHFVTLLPEGGESYMLTFKTQEEVGVKAVTDSDSLHVKLSPIPIGEWMYISGNFREARRVEVYDMRGIKRLNVANMVPGKGVYMGSLRAGLYYVTVTTDRGVFRTKVLKR